MEKFQLLPKKQGNKGHVIDKRRVLLGRAEACDLVIPFPNVSSIHAVIEIGESGHKVFDMNSTNGTFIGGKKIVSAEIKEGDVVSFAGHSYVFKRHALEDLPPVLDMLESTDPSRVLPDLPSTPPQTPSPPDPSRMPQTPATPSPPIIEKKQQKDGLTRSLFFKKMPKAPVKIISEPVYPLAADPKAEMSEYIFEDIDTLYPIFQYQMNEDAVEVIILFQDRIYSVDYLPRKEKVYYLVGSDPQDKEDVEYAHLPKKDRVPFIDVKNNEVFINVLQGYQCVSISGKKQEGSSICLIDQDILRLAKDDLQIFIRRTDSPPLVKTAPFFRRNKDLRKYLFLMMLVLIPITLFISSLEINKDKDKEKNPERIATILYKKKVFKKPKPKKPKVKVKPKPEVPKPKTPPVVKKEIKPPKKIEKPIKKIVEKPKPVKKKIEKKAVTKKQPVKIKLAPPKKAQPIKAKVNRVAPKVSAPRKKKSPKIAVPKVKKRKFQTAKSKGNVDTYKAANFKSTLNSLLAKGGNTSSIKAVADADVSNLNTASVSGASSSATLKTAKVRSAVGSISGVAQGKLDSGRGTQGIVGKKDIYTAGVPGKTVILGGMDPDVIKSILLEHLPQFRYCYQKELDQQAQSFNGMVRMDFVIGASGHVTKTGLSSISGRLPSSVKGCIVKVLKGIRFPEPAGGGVVEVSQPFNFYPRMK